jgi:hypothetical protein
VRETKYAKDLREPGTIKWRDGSEGRLERLLIKKTNQEEIRFSWWKNGKIATRPLDLGEDDLIALFQDAVAKNIFTDSFRSKLRTLL